MVGVDGSKEFGNIITFDTKEGKIVRNIDKPQYEMLDQSNGIQAFATSKVKRNVQKAQIKSRWKERRTSRTIRKVVL